MRSVRIMAWLLVLCLLAGCAGQPPVSSGTSSSGISPGVAPPSPTEPAPGSSGASSSVTVIPEPPALPAEPAEQFAFTRDSFPRLNGSTSTVPLGKAIASVLLGETQDEVDDLIRFSKTTQSYRQLMNGYADLLIAAEPAAVIWEEKAARDFAWEMSPFAVDGLVFLVNESNPVDSLTIEQVQKIYTGEITNWSQVGGDDLEIVPFQRNAEAGSQTAMLKLVMGELPMMEAPAEYVQSEMGDLIEAVAAYDGTAAAIGYTVYYYASDMNMADGLKILAINGTEPCDKTIRSGAYPFLNNYYTLIPAGLPEDAPARVMYDWLLSEDGQRLVANQGYVSVLDVPDTLPSEQEAARSTVRASWESLTAPASAQPLYTWYEPRSADGLLHPRDDYGTLLTYIGTISSVRYLIDRLPLFGLVTADGRVVTEPVYASLGFYGDHFLRLQRGEVTGYRETDWGREPEGGFHNTVAAADGSWVREVGMLDDCLLLKDGRLLLALQDRSLLILNADGSTAAEFSPAQLRPVLGEHYSFAWERGFWLNTRNAIPSVGSADDRTGKLITLCWLDIDNGAVLTEAPAGWTPDPPDSSDQPVPPVVPVYGQVDIITDHVTGHTYYYGYNRDEKRYDLLDLSRVLLFPDCDLREFYFDRPLLRAGLIATYEDGCFCYHSLETGEAVFRWPVRSNSD